MATKAHADDHAGHGDHGHGHHGGPDHVPHVLPLKVYFATFGALLFLTFITVVASRFDFGPANLFIAIAIAMVKATVVAAIFMHLKYDLRFHALTLGSSLVFLSIFVGFTMFDTNYRGRADATEAERPYDVKRPFLGTRAEAAERARRNLPPPGTAIPVEAIPPATTAAPVPPAATVGTAAPLERTLPGDTVPGGPPGVPPAVETAKGTTGESAEGPMAPPGPVPSATAPAPAPPQPKR